MSTLLLVGLIFSAEEFSLAKPQPSRAHLYADPNVRRIEVDSFIDQFPTSNPIADDVLRRIDPSDLLISSTGAADVNLNPEPSSLLIWGVSSLGISSGAFAIRRRRADETAQPTS